jgi:hypothetical protein
MIIFKYVILSIVCLFFFSAAHIVNGQEKNSQKNIKVSQNTSEITFEKTVHDFGSILKKGDCNTEFVFKNTGKVPLILYEVKPSCDCTTPSWPKEPIMPGKTGTIKVVYDTKETGVFSKTITVSSNAVNSHVELTIQGEVYE